MGQEPTHPSLLAGILTLGLLGATHAYPHYWAEHMQRCEHPRQHYGEHPGPRVNTDVHIALDDIGHPAKSWLPGKVHTVHLTYSLASKFFITATAGSFQEEGMGNRYVTCQGQAWHMGEKVAQTTRVAVRWQAPPCCSLDAFVKFEATAATAEHSLFLQNRIELVSDDSQCDCTGAGKSDWQDIDKEAHIGTKDRSRVRHGHKMEEHRRALHVLPSFTVIGIGMVCGICIGLVIVRQLQIIYRRRLGTKPKKLQGLLYA